MMDYLQFIPLFTAFFVALILLVVMTPLAHQFGLVDQPSYRKRHNGIVPLTGGVAIFVAVLVASVLTDVWMKNNPLFFTASAFIVLLGMLDDRFDLILMDISMPKLDGVGATRMLRQFGKSRHSPIVAVTAHSQPEHMREFLAAGMDRVLTKPLRMATLEQLFEDMGHVANANHSAEAAPAAVQDETEQEDDEIFQSTVGVFV